MSTPNRTSGTTINIDVGGTFTDCYLTMDGRGVWGKAATTPDDLSRGFLNALAEACNPLGIEVSSLLSHTDIRC